MLRMQLEFTSVLCQGRQEPEGGVVLGFHHDYIILCIFIYYVNIILLWIC